MAGRQNLQGLSHEQVFYAIQKNDHAVLHENGLATKESDIARYLEVQKETNFIFNQFQIGDIFAEYEKFKELRKNYAEVANSICANKNSKILNFIGIIFTLI
ncbi:MAG: hypothetical protein NC489_42725 [Ruminococcus flavefaciens]|nr:hypothetical protein [Ruminococcus flavefaciens]